MFFNRKFDKYRIKTTLRNKTGITNYYNKESIQRKRKQITKKLVA